MQLKQAKNQKKHITTQLETIVVICQFKSKYWTEWQLIVHIK